MTNFDHLMILPSRSQLDKELCRLQAEVEQLRDLVREIGCSGVGYECRKYVTIQVDPVTWKQCRRVSDGL